MSIYQDIFHFLAPYQISDEVMGISYDNVGDQKRALVKQAIGFHFSAQRFITPQSGEAENFYKHSASGLFYAVSKKKTPYLFCVADNTFDTQEEALSPALLLSMLCPAIMADVENIILLFNTQPSDGVLSTLELCGIENIFIFDTCKSLLTSQEDVEQQEFSLEHEFSSKKDDDFFDFVKLCLTKLTGQGRFILFSHPTVNQGSANHGPANQGPANHEPVNHGSANHAHKAYYLIEYVKSLGITYHVEKTKPTIFAYPQQEENVRFAYGQAEIVVSKQSKQVRVNGVTAQDNENAFATQKKNISHLFTMPLENGQNQNKPYDISFVMDTIARQNYCEGMELCYIHPTITIDFFMNTLHGARMLY